MRTPRIADVTTRSSGLVARLLFFLFLLVTGTGCYTYRPVQEIEALAPGERVRPELTREGAASFETGSRRSGREAEGDVVRTDGDTLYLAVGNRAVTMRSRGSVTGIDTVGIPLDHVRGLERKEMDAGRTAIVAGAGGLALGAYVLWRFSGSGGAAPRDGGGDQDDAFRPWFFLGFRW